MFVAILLMIAAGMHEPGILKRPDPPFVSHNACDEWAGQEARRIERVLEEMDEDKRPLWEIRCVPVGPLVESRNEQLSH